MPTDPVRTVTGIRLHCPECGGGPQEVPERKAFVCFDCRVEFVVHRDHGFVHLTWPENKEDSDDT